MTWGLRMALSQEKTLMGWSEDGVGETWWLRDESWYQEDRTGDGEGLNRLDLFLQCTVGTWATPNCSY